MRTTIKHQCQCWLTSYTRNKTVSFPVLLHCLHLFFEYVRNTFASRISFYRTASCKFTETNCWHCCRVRTIPTTTTTIKGTLSLRMGDRFCWANMTIGGIIKILRALNLPTSGRGKQSMRHKKTERSRDNCRTGERNATERNEIYCVCVCMSVCVMVTLARFPLPVEVDRWVAMTVADSAHSICIFGRKRTKMWKSTKRKAMQRKT